jgi:hypothetical protein
MITGVSGRRSLVSKFVRGIVCLAFVLGVLLPHELAAQGLPVRTGSHVPVWLWFIGSGILGLAIAYGVIKTRSRTSAEKATTEQATKDLYAKEDRDSRGL